MKSNKRFTIALLNVFALLYAVSIAAFAEPLTLKTVSQDGFLVKFNPKNIERSGICIDILKAIEKVDSEVKFSGLETVATSARLEAMLDDGSIDLYAGMAKTPEREKKYLFIEPPMYSSSQALVVRKDDNVVINSFDDIKKLGNAGTILVVPGTVQDTYLKSVGGLIIDSSSRDTVNNLKKLRADRGRFYYGADINTVNEIKEQDMEKDLKVLPVRFQPIAIYIALRKNADPKIVNRIQSDMKILSDSGELQKIFKKYAH